ncbi:helix-turn-helix domain-containing protein [Kushneria phosphatilytica]|nr:helix-turn-helix transcriptional regulator [Kushneria phosphatilytica]
MMNELGARIRSFREQAGLSKAALARRVGVSDVTISYWENGIIRRIGHSRLQPLARALGCNITQLLGQQEYRVEDTRMGTDYQSLPMFVFDHSPDSLRADKPPISQLARSFLPEALRKLGDHLLIPDPDSHFPFCGPGNFMLAESCTGFQDEGLYLLEQRRLLTIRHVESPDPHEMILQDEQRQKLTQSAAEIRFYARLRAIWHFESLPA